MSCIGTANEGNQEKDPRFGELNPSAGSFSYISTKLACAEAKHMHEMLPAQQQECDWTLFEMLVDGKAQTGL